MEPGTGFSGALTPSTPVKQVIQRNRAEPIVVVESTPVTALPAVMALNRDCHTIAVVNGAGVLVGVIPVDVVVQHLLVHLMPAEFLKDVMEPERAAELAKEQHARTAGDLMDPPVSIVEEETVREAFHVLHQAGLQGVPVVDENQRVTGYLGLLQLLLFGLQQ